MCPPHSIALGGIYVASLLLSFEQPPVPLREGETNSADLASMLNQHTEWEDKYKTKAQDLVVRFSILLVIIHTHEHSFKDIAHIFLDLLVAYTQSSSTSSANTAIHTILSLSSSHSRQTTSPAFSPPTPAPTFRDVPLQRRPAHSPQDFMRQTEDSPRKRRPCECGRAEYGKYRSRKCQCQ